MWRFPVVSRVIAFSTTSSTTTRWTSSSSATTIVKQFAKLGAPWSPGSMGKDRRTYATQVSAATTDDSDPTTDIMVTNDKAWNIGGLLKEVPRLTTRCHKKIGKARQRLEKANEEVERLTSDPTVSLQELEQCPNVGALEAELQELQTRLQNLNKLEVLLVEHKAKAKNSVLPPHVAELVIQLDVQDEPLQQTVKISKKEKGPRNMESFRLPYRRYYTKNKTEIRVRKMISIALTPHHAVKMLN